MELCGRQWKPDKYFPSSPPENIDFHHHQYFAAIIIIDTTCERTAGVVRRALRGDLAYTVQGGITCGAIDEHRKSSKAIDERVIKNFRDKNVVIVPFRDNK